MSDSKENDLELQAVIEKQFEDTENSVSPLRECEKSMSPLKMDESREVVMVEGGDDNELIEAVEGDDLKVKEAGHTAGEDQISKVEKLLAQIPPDWEIAENYGKA